MYFGGVFCICLTVHCACMRICVCLLRTCNSVLITVDYYDFFGLSSQKCFAVFFRFIIM